MCLAMIGTNHTFVHCCRINMLRAKLMSELGLCTNLARGWCCLCVKSNHVEGFKHKEKSQSM